MSLRTKPDTILEGQEKFKVSLITADNNADISHTQGDAQIIVLPDPGASGTVSIKPEQRTVYIGEKTINYCDENTLTYSLNIFRLLGNFVTKGHYLIVLPEVAKNTYNKEYFSKETSGLF